MNDQTRLPADLYCFRGPRSYTGLDCVEIHTLGSPPLLEWIMERLLAAGARAAQPGEFTAQAFLNGRLSLDQAESVAAIIHAQSDAQLRAARHAMKGGLSAKIAEWMEALANLAALVEAEIDFSEEAINFVSPTELSARVGALESELAALLEGAAASRRAETLPRVLLLGAPNAGKSTLMNALTGIDRAICSPVAGTTRDILSAPLHVGSIEVLLLDAAGVDPAEPLALLRDARDRTLETSAEVDAVCIVIDARAPRSDHAALSLHEIGAAVVVAINKTDLCDRSEIDRAVVEIQRTFGAPVVPVSARTQAGLGPLKAELEKALQGRVTSPGEMLPYFSTRQQEALRSAQLAMQAAVAECGQCQETLDRVELLALLLREALDALGEVSGHVTTEDLLSKVFSEFCIGK